MKIVYIIFILLLIDCKGQEDKKEYKLENKEYNSISNKWYGKYALTINEDSEDWRNIHEIKLKTSKDSIIYSAEGFQLYQSYKLAVVEKNNVLQLSFERALDNTESWALKKTKNFGTLILDKDKYIWNCPYIDINFTNGRKNKYILTKK